MSKTDKFVHLIKKMYHYSLYNGNNGNNGSSFSIYIAEIKKKTIHEELQKSVWSALCAVIFL